MVALTDIRMLHIAIRTRINGWCFLMNLSTLRLFQLISPALPVGAFSYSQGLEHAVERQIVHDSETTKQWLLGILNHNLLSVDLPIALRCFDAIAEDKPEMLNYWNSYLLACRETSELRDESIQMAKALWRLLGQLPEQDKPIAGRSSPKVAITSSMDWVSVFTYAAYSWNVSKSDMLLGYAWSWLENQIAAAIKLVPLGQTQGQQLLHEMSADLVTVVDKAHNLADEQLGQVAPMLAMMSSLHETQYSRLFRS